MGRRKINVGTAVSRVIKDAGIPNSTKTGVIKALFRGGDIRDYVLEDLVSSIGVRAEAMYAYGRDHYTHGLPSGQFTIAAENIDDVVGTVLLSIENVAVAMDYLHYGSPNNLHIGWLTLMASHGYNPATNQLAALTATKGTPVYLDDMVVVIPSSGLGTIEPHSLEQWGIAAKAGYAPGKEIGSPEFRALTLPTGVQVDPVGATEFVRVKYAWNTVAGVMRGSFDIPLTGYNSQADYYQARYRVGGVAKYWMYREGAGTYPTLDVLFDKAPLSGGSFFPFTYFRYNKVSEASNPSTQSYKTSKKLVDYLGMDYDQVSDGINSNPGIADVEQAMLVLAVPASTTNELERRYLWEFFNDLHLASAPAHRHRTEEEAALQAIQDILAAEASQVGLRAPGMVIQDSRFKMSLENQGVYKRRKAGSIGVIGAHHSEVVTRLVNHPFVTVDSETGNSFTHFIDSPIVSHYYRRQISLGFYDEIQVVELRVQFHILNQYTAIGDGDDAILIIPLDRDITSNFSIPDREALYARSLHFVFNSLIITKVRWYQTEEFQMVLLIVAIVITVMSWGADGGSAIAAALAAGSYALAANLIIMMVVEMLIARLVFKIFVKEVGVEAAFVIAIVAAAFGVISAANAGSVAGAPYAGTMLTVASGINAAIGTQMQFDMADLLQQATQFDLLQKEQIKLLDTARDLLDNRSMLSPFVIFGEKPDDFFNRTVHSGNIGLVGISAVSFYVDSALTLPTLNNSLGE